MVIDVEMTWTKSVLFWLNTVLLCYNFYMAWQTDPGFIKSNREQKLQVSLKKLEPDTQHFPQENKIVIHVLYVCQFFNKYTY